MEHNKHLTIFIAFFASAVLEVVSSSCTSPYKSVDGYCFYFNGGTVQFIAAQEICEQHNGTLAVLDTDEKVNAVSQFVLEQHYSGSLFIGGYDQGHEGQWIWNTLGTVVANAKWDRRSPIGGPSNNCLVLNPKNGTFIDHICTSHKPFVCQQLEPSCFTPSDDNHKYIPEVLVSSSWIEAKENCERNGYTLAHVTSEQDSEQIVKIMKFVAPSVSLWVGGYDQGHETSWKWTGNTGSMAYTNWYPGKPTFDATKNCLYLNAYNNYTWFDGGCDISLPYICQKVPQTCTITTTQ